MLPFPSAPPTMLVVTELVAPLVNAQKRYDALLEEIENSASDSSDLIYQGLFVLAFASLETALGDSLSYLLEEFPQKLGKQQVDARQAARGAAIETVVEGFVMSLAYKPLDEFLQRFCDLASIEPLSSGELLEVILEAKATRNVLLHNNLRSNSEYLRKAGPRARATREGERLKLNQAYLHETIEACKTLLGGIHDRLVVKYADYTRVSAFRRLWDWVFDNNSPACRFDDYWDVLADGTVQAANEPPACEARMASGEQAFLALFRLFYNGDPNMYSHAYGPAYRGPSISLTSLVGDMRTKFVHVVSVGWKLNLSSNCLP